MDRSHTYQAIFWSYIVQLKYVLYAWCSSQFLVPLLWPVYRTQDCSFLFHSMAMQQRCGMWFLCHVDHEVINLTPFPQFFAHSKQSKTRGGETRLALETVTGYVLNYLVRVCSELIITLALAFWQSSSSWMQVVRQVFSASNSAQLPVDYGRQL